MKVQNIISKISERTPAILGSENFLRYAVLLPLIEKDNEVHILFEVRSHLLRRQPGEICFPGGKSDPDDLDVQHTAIRETSEELGLPEECINHVLPLDYMVSPFGTIIYPFVGVITDYQNIEPNQSEVAEVFSVPLTFFQKVQPEVFQINFKMEPEIGFPFELIPGGENYNWQTRKMEEVFFHYEGKVIWGLTARIVKHFVEEIQKT